MAQSLTDLPANILIEIIVRLPLRTIFVSRSVCKTFLSLTTPNPHFTALHTSNAAPILAFQFGDASSPSDLLRSAEPDLSIIAAQISDLKPLFQLPEIRESTLYLSRTKFREGNRFSLVNSCNGLVYFVRRLAGDDERSLVCNPVTNEYIVVPEGEPIFSWYPPTKSMWLGFSPGTEQYKMLRILGSVEHAAQVFVIGSSDLWRDIGDTPPCGDLFWDLCSTFVNGVMYWVDERCKKLISFDFTREKFGEIGFPVQFQNDSFGHISIGVLGGSFCLSCNDSDTQYVDLWVMKHGNQDSWKKVFVIDTERITGLSLYGEFKPLQFLRNGEIAMLWMGNTLVCYDPRTQSFRFSDLLRLQLTPKTVVLTPSFASLKDTLKVEKVLSQHVRPRGDEREP